MKLGHRILIRVIELAVGNNFDPIKSSQVFDLISPFIINGADTEELDLMTICKLEVLLGEQLLYIPTAKQWRRIKLERLNEICNEV